MLKAFAVLGGIVTFLVVLAALSAFGGWIVMLAFGVVHGSFWASCVTPGFFPSWGISVLFGLLFRRVVPTTTPAVAAKR